MKTIAIACSGADTLTLEDLADFQGDLKRLSDENYAKLRKQILELGFSEPFSVWKHGKKRYILNGHQRRITLLRMQAEGYEIPPLPVSWVKAKSIKEAKLKVLSLTSQYGEMTEEGLQSFVAEAELDMEDVAKDFRFPEVDWGALAGNGQEEGETDADAIPDAPVDPVSDRGEVYKLGDHRLMCGDATKAEDVALVMDGSEMDAVVTDPPYGIGFQYESHRDDRDEWFDLMNLVIPALKAIAPFVVMPCCRIKALQWWYANHDPDWIIAWYKGSPGHRSAIGFNDWEPHLVWGKPTNQMHDYFQTACGFDKSLNHPCPKPVAWAEWLVERAAERQGRIYDPFMGSGTTLIASERLDRHCYGMEIEPRYCDIIRKRWAEYVHGEECDWESAAPVITA